MAQQGEWKEGMATHENALFVCFGGLSNTGYLTALGAIEAVRRVGLKKASVFCLAALPAKVPGVVAKTKAAKKIITVDGCPANCARKVVEQAGFTVSKSVTLSELGIKKVPLHVDLDGQPRPLEEYVSQEDVFRVADAVVAAVEES